MRGLLIAVTVAFAADLATTAVAFGMGAVEANPVLAGWSFWQIAAAKTAVLGGLLWFMRRKSRFGDAVLWYGVVSTGAVSLWNLYGIIRYGVLM